MIGSLFSGIGGLDLAVEHVTGQRTAWQIDLVGAAVRRRHWPDALQVEGDIQAVDPLSLPPVDVLCAGFACQDLSCSGKGKSRKDLDKGERTGLTYRETIRFVRALRPRLLVLENVPAVLRHQRRIERDLYGHGCTWVRCGAWDAGAPHIRRRVFVVAIRGAIGRGVLDAPTGGRWRAEEDERTRATATAARTWPTPTAGDAKASGSRCLPSMATPGTSLTDAILPHRVTRDDLRPWPTPAARDYKTGDIDTRVGTPSLSQACSDYPRGTWGNRLNPDWIETLMGLPVGWTLPDGPRLTFDQAPRWPRGRYPETWDRSIPWPGYDWEPARVLPDGPPIPGRPARIHALGNAVCPQQGILALRSVL